MTASRKRYTQEFKDELCRGVINTPKPIKDVAAAYGVGPETLGMVKYREANGGTEADLTATSSSPTRMETSSAPGAPPGGSTPGVATPVRGSL